MGTGEFKDKEYARRVRLCTWKGIKKFTKRGITPTDIDGVMESNRFRLTLEFKTLGATMQWGQWLAMYRDLEVYRTKGTLFIVEHKAIGDVDFFEAERLEIIKWDNEKRRVCSSGILNVDDESLGLWIDEWQRHSDEEPNNFITQFRKFSGIYPKAAHVKDSVWFPEKYGTREKKESMVPDSHWVKASEDLK